MNPVDGILYGISVVMAPENLLAALLGTLMGTAIGVLPGLGPAAGAALLLPLTFTLPPVTGLIALAGILYGTMYGGSTTSILLNIPGETSTVVTCIEGYQMTKRGRAGAALTVVAVGSFFAGTLSIAGVMLFAPLLSSMALTFGSADFFVLTTVGLLALSRVSGGSFARSSFSAALGLGFATVGMEPLTSVPRFTLGMTELMMGIEIVPVAVGLFGISEMFFVAERLAARPQVKGIPLRELFPTREEWRRSVPAWSRGTVLGFLLGVLPGPTAVIATFVSYRLEKAVSRGRNEFGKGAIEGVAGPEAANNAAATSHFIPLLSLGLPFTAMLALILAAMMVHGIQPGPLLMIDHPDVFWGILMSMYIGNIMLLVINLPLIGVWVSVLRIPLHILIPLICLYAMIGSFSTRNAVFDLWVLTAFGVLGYVLRKFDFELAPLILAVVLGPMMEKYFREALFLSRGNAFTFVGSPIANSLWAVGLGVLIFGALRGRLSRRLDIGIDAVKES